MKVFIIMSVFIVLNLCAFEVEEVLTLKNENAFLTKQTQLQKAVLDATLELEFNFDDNSRVVNVNRLRLDAKDKIEPNEFTTSSYSSYSKPLVLGDVGSLELRELYYEKVFDESFVKFGKMQTVWGKADGIKLLDKLNPQDFSEFILEDFEESRIPLWSFSFVQNFGDSEFEFVWIVDTTYHKTAKRDGSYAFTSPRIIPQDEVGVNVQLNETHKPNNVLKDSDIALRYTKSFESIEIGFFYFYLYEDFAVLYQDYDGLSNTLNINPEYERSHLYGFSMDYSKGDFVYRLESALTRGKYFLNTKVNRGVKQSDEFSYIFGVDWYALEESLVSLQFSQSYLLDDDSGFTRPEVDNTVTLMYKKDMLNNTLHAEVLLIHNLHNKDGVIRPKVKYELDEETLIYTGLDSFYGDKEGLYGQFKEQNRMLIGIEKTF